MKKGSMRYVIIQDIKVFCRRNKLKFNESKMTIEGVKIIIKNERFYTIDGRDVMLLWSKKVQQEKERENIGRQGYIYHKPVSRGTGG